MLVKYSRELCKVWEVDLLQITLCVFVLLCFCLFHSILPVLLCAISKSFKILQGRIEEIEESDDKCVYTSGTSSTLLIMCLKTML